MRRQIAVLPVLLYPAWSHLCVAYEIPAYSVPGLVVLLACAIALRGLQHPPSSATLLGLAGIAAVAGWDIATPTPLAVYMPPIVVPAALAWVFGRTLLPGRTALITHFAINVMGDDMPGTARYTRGVTFYWTLIFVLLALEALLLGVYASWPVWSLFTNCINYLVVVCAFVAEFALRRVRFGRSKRLGEFLLHLVRTDFRQLD